MYRYHSRESNGFQIDGKTIALMFNVHMRYVECQIKRCATEACVYLRLVLRRWVFFFGF